MAHEVGHLLSDAAHGPTGLMWGKWDKADCRCMARGEMLIPAKGAAKMRQQVRRRAAAAYLR